MRGTPMTEAEWLACTDPQPLLEFLRRKASDRKGAFERMPLLADALEASGCPNADLIEHCRSGGEHARGGSWIRC
jgi:hypothetical protein